MGEPQDRSIQDRRKEERKKQNKQKEYMVRREKAIQGNKG
jgi:hypothetical protein